MVEPAGGLVLSTRSSSFLFWSPPRLRPPHPHPTPSPPLPPPLPRFGSVLWFEGPATAATRRPIPHSFRSFPRCDRPAPVSPCRALGLEAVDQHGGRDHLHPSPPGDQLRGLPLPWAVRVLGLQHASCRNSCAQAPQASRPRRSVRSHPAPSGPTGPTPRTRTAAPPRPSHVGTRHLRWRCS